METPYPLLLCCLQTSSKHPIPARVGAPKALIGDKYSIAKVRKVPAIFNVHSLTSRWLVSKAPIKTCTGVHAFKNVPLFLLTAFLNLSVCACARNRRLRFRCIRYANHKSWNAGWKWRTLPSSGLNFDDGLYFQPTTYSSIESAYTLLPRIMIWPCISL